MKKSFITSGPRIVPDVRSCNSLYLEQQVFLIRVENSVDPDQMALSEAS